MFLRMRLANWLTKGAYLAACKSACFWQEEYALMVDALDNLEGNIVADRGDARFFARLCGVKGAAGILKNGVVGVLCADPNTDASKLAMLELSKRAAAYRDRCK